MNWIHSQFVTLVPSEESSLHCDFVHFHLGHSLLHTCIQMQKLCPFALQQMQWLHQRVSRRLLQRRRLGSAFLIAAVCSKTRYGCATRMRMTRARDLSALTQRRPARRAAFLRDVRLKAVCD